MATPKGFVKDDLTPAPQLAGFQDDQLHPQIVEALKRLEVAKDAYAHALANVDRQYLIALSDPEVVAQVDAVRALF
jgi:hypothetical protein